MSVCTILLVACSVLVALVAVLVYDVVHPGALDDKPEDE